jgi:hypothetical protein
MLNHQSGLEILLWCVFTILFTILMVHLLVHFWETFFNGFGTHLPWCKTETATTTSLIRHSRASKIILRKQQQSNLEYEIFEHLNDHYHPENNLWNELQNIKHPRKQPQL